MNAHENSNSKTLSKLDSLLEGQDPDFTARVLRIVNETGLRPNDPLFTILISTSTLKLLLEDSPKQLKGTMDYCLKSMLEHMSAYEAAAAKGTEKRIATAVDRLVEKTQISKAQVTLQAALPAGLAFVFTLGIGILGGMAYSRWQFNQVPQDPLGPRQLTRAEANALDWAMSNEGKFAKNIMDWNDNLANRGCEKEIDEFGFTYRLGNKEAVSGFCAVWTAPPQERRFVKFKTRRSKD